MDSVCTNCGNALRPGARFCPACGDSAAAAAAPASESKTMVGQLRPNASPGVARQPKFARNSRVMLMIVAGVALVLIAAIAVTLVLRRRSMETQSAQAPTKPPVAEPQVTKASDSDVQSLTDLANEFEALQGQADDTSRKLSATLARYQRTGGKLPPNFGTDLTDEQRAMLAERIQQERAGTRALLQEILDRDRQLKDLQVRSHEIGLRLPANVVAQGGARHDRVAIDFLVKQGVSTQKAYDLVSQMNLQEVLLPGFRIWMLYQNGQFGTWVTKGNATTTPQEHQKRLARLLTDERDQAVQAVATLKGQVTDLEKARDKALGDVQNANDETAALMKIAEAERARASATSNLLQYGVGAKKQLVNAKVITKDMRLKSLDGVESLSLNLAWRSELTIDGSAYGLSKIKKVTLLPEIFVPKVDFEVSISGEIAKILVINGEKFKKTHFLVVIE